MDPNVQYLKIVVISDIVNFCYYLCLRVTYVKGMQNCCTRHPLDLAHLS